MNSAQWAGHNEIFPPHLVTRAFFCGILFRSNFRVDMCMSIRAVHKKWRDDKIKGFFSLLDTRCSVTGSSGDQITLSEWEMSKKRERKQDANPILTCGESYFRSSQEEVLLSFRSWNRSVFLSLWQP